MVAIINFARSLKDSFFYNDKKVDKGVAKCLLAENYPMAAEQMNKMQQLNMLLKRAQLNPQVQENSVHITLNFDPSDQVEDELLKGIAREYMEAIGFGAQPYLVFRHKDTKHPHVHIVTTNIGPDGLILDTHWIGLKKSEPARKAIEKKYGLVVAGGQKKEAYEISPALYKSEYSELETKKTISVVLKQLLDTYKCASIGELDALMRSYNLTVKTGTKGSRTYQHNGLLYQFINVQGTLLGKEIKASRFAYKPTLANLTIQFNRHKKERMQHLPRVKNAIDMALRSSKVNSVEELQKVLLKDRIRMVCRENKKGGLYGVTFIDHENKVVFNGSAIGTGYSIAAIQDRIHPSLTLPAAIAQTQSKAKVPRKKSVPASNPKPAEGDKIHLPDLIPGIGKEVNQLAQDILEAQPSPNYLPYELRRRRRKYKKRNTDNP